MDKSGKYIALFDLDKTILDANSGSVLIKEAHSKGFLKNRNLIKAFYYSLQYKLNLKDPAIIINNMAKWLDGVSVEEIENLAEAVVNKHLIGTIRAGALAEIEHHSKNNAEVVILSSAIKEICNHIGNHLGIETVLCTSMAHSEGLLTGLPENNICFGPHKKGRFLQYCREQNYNPDEAYYYGDSISDLPVLESVGNPVCVTPDRRLKRIAAERNWRICLW